MVGILAQVDDIFSWAPRGGKLIGTGWGMRIYKAMGTLTSYVGAIFVGRPLTKGSTGFCRININLTHMRNLHAQEIVNRQSAISNQFNLRSQVMII